MVSSPMVRRVGNLLVDGDGDGDNEAHHQYGGWRHGPQCRGQFLGPTSPTSPTPSWVGGGEISLTRGRADMDKEEK